MGRAKEIIVKVIPSKIAQSFVKKYHYSGSIVPNSNLHFGCFLDDKLHGVLQFGPPMDKRNVFNFVDVGLDIHDGWNTMIELNRMAFDDYLPRNSESRCISIAIKLIKKQAPHIKWILSFADGTQCGDGTIYRASGFKLYDITPNRHIYRLANGEIAVRHGNKKVDFKSAEKLDGYQFKYIYLIDKNCKVNLPLIPFEMIDKVKGGMYKGEKIPISKRREDLSEEMDSHLTS